MKYAIFCPNLPGLFQHMLATRGEEIGQFISLCATFNKSTARCYCRSKLVYIFWKENCRSPPIVDLENHGSLQIFTSIQSVSFPASSTLQAWLEIAGVRLGPSRDETWCEIGHVYTLDLKASTYCKMYVSSSQSSPVASLCFMIHEPYKQVTHVDEIPEQLRRSMRKCRGACLKVGKQLADAGNFMVCLKMGRGNACI